MASFICVTFVSGATLFARNTPVLEPAELVDMQQTIFHSGGTLELRDSYGDVQIVGWDQPQIEVKVKKSTHRRYAPEEMERALDELDKIVVATDSVDVNHVVIRTEFPTRSAFGTATRAKSRVNLQYLIHVPRQTRIIVRHEAGELKVHDVAANMDVIARSGDIQVELPESERFLIEAHSKQGEVTSDWCTHSKIPSDMLPRYRVSLSVDCGDISIRKKGAESDDEASNG